MSGKDMLGHLATRETSWPEYCLEAVDEMISAVQELSRTPPATRDSPSGLTGSQLLQGHGQPQGPLHDVNITSTPNKRRGTFSGWNANAGGIEPESSSGLPPNHASISSVGDVQQGTSVQVRAASNDGPQSTMFQQTPTRAGTGIPFGVNNSSTGLAVVPEAIDASIDAGLVEGQESMMWYDQLFASSFSAIDNPFLVAAEFDASIDPTWNYLR